MTAPPGSLLVVFTNHVDGREDEFNDWYDNVHLREVCAVPGIAAAQRFSPQVAKLPDNDLAEVPPPTHGHLALYTVDGEPEEIMTTFVARLKSGEMQLSPALDLSSINMAVWSPSGPAVNRA